MATFPEGFPYLYESGFKQALQQSSARTRPYVNTVPVNGESRRFNKISKRSVVQITERFGTTNPTDTEISFRSLNVSFFKDAAIVDRIEAMQLGSVGGPQSAIQMAQWSAMNRARDLALINGLTGVSYEGRTGGTQVAFPTSTQSIAVGCNGTGTPANSGLTFAKMLRLNEMFGLANISGQDVEGNSNKILIISHHQLTDLLKEERFTSDRYQAIKPLAGPGEIYSLLGWTIVVVDADLLPYNPATEVRTCIAYSKEHVVFGVAEESFARVSELPEHNYNVQMYLQAGFGATRLFDEGVILVFADESP